MVYSQRRDHLNKSLLNSNKVTCVMLHNDNNNNSKKPALLKSNRNSSDR